ncbi:MAG: hypothetical protein LBB20_02655 [Puniceicoccales bacterium]|jgi:hypothetical protein|nr:hypothetical protein [Puniceicoccales bacterium]
MMDGINLNRAAGAVFGKNNAKINTKDAVIPQDADKFMKLVESGHVSRPAEKISITSRSVRQLDRDVSLRAPRTVHDTARSVDQQADNTPHTPLAKRTVRTISSGELSAKLPGILRR